MISPSDALMGFAAEVVDGVPLNAVLVVEFMDEDGEMSLATIVTEETATWRFMGMLDFANTSLRNRLRRIQDE